MAVVADTATLAMVEQPVAFDITLETVTNR